MNRELIIRYLSWDRIYTRNVGLFSSWLNTNSIEKNKAMFAAKMHDFFRRGFSDVEITERICDYSKDLFSQSANNKINLLDKLNESILFYQNNEIVMNKKYLLSLDSLYPRYFANVLEENLIGNKDIQYVPIIFEYHGDLSLLGKLEKKAIIGTRQPENETKTLKQIEIISKKYPDSVCVTGLASGVDSMGVLTFKQSICFLGENLSLFLKKTQRDSKRLTAKKKVLETGLLLSHIVSTEIPNKVTSRLWLLERNLFVVLLSNSVHPIDFSIKSGTISAINYAIKNKKNIYSPKDLVDDKVLSKYKDKVVFY